MGLVLRIEKRKMPVTAKRIFETAEAGGIALFVPAMALAEIAYLSEKKRIDTPLKAALAYVKRSETIQIDPMTSEVVAKAFEIDDVPELHDRIIAATDSSRNIPLITNDPAIRQSRFLTTVW